MSEKADRLGEGSMGNAGILHMLAAMGASAGGATRRTCRVVRAVQGARVDVREAKIAPHVTKASRARSDEIDVSAAARAVLRRRYWVGLRPHHWQTWHVRIHPPSWLFPLCPFHLPVVPAKAIPFRPWATCSARQVNALPSSVDEQVGYNMQRQTTQTLPLGHPWPNRPNPATA
eukprot:scaffold236872_cov33-Tisochrysis_lutea.AAC.2